MLSYLPKAVISKSKEAFFAARDKKRLFELKSQITTELYSSFIKIVTRFSLFIALEAGSRRFFYQEKIR